MSKEIKEENNYKFSLEMKLGHNQQTEKTIIIEDFLVNPNGEIADSNKTDENNYEPCSNELIFQEGTNEDLNLRYGLTKPFLLFRGEPYISISPNCNINIIIYFLEKNKNRGF